MSIKVVWNPSLEADIHSYRVEKSTTGLGGTYSSLATILHNLSGANYDSVLGKFFYEDAGGAPTDWYRLVAIDIALNESPPSAPFQPTATVPPPWSVSPVDIYVKDDSVSAAPIQNAKVGIYDPVTFDLVANEFTDSTGRAAFLLTSTVSPGAPYEVRVFKAGVRFTNPSAIKVIEPPPTGATNRFDVVGTVVFAVYPPSSDPRTCRCTGYFLTMGNRPMANVYVRVSTVADVPVPKLVYGGLIPQERMEARTNAEGKVSFDLIRGGEFFVTWGGEEDETRRIVVPNSAASNLIDLIHPAPTEFQWDPADAPGNTVSVAAGVDKPVHGLLLFTSGQTTKLEFASFITATTSDEGVATVLLASDGVMIHGTGTGTCTISLAVRPDLQPNRVPAIPFTYSPLTVTIP